MSILELFLAIFPVLFLVIFLVSTLLSLLLSLLMSLSMLLLLLLSRSAPCGGAIGTMGGGADGMRIDERRRHDLRMAALTVRLDEEEWSRNRRWGLARKDVLIRNTTEREQLGEDKLA